MASAGEGDLGARRKRRRLSRSGEFDRVYRQGRSHANRHLVVYSFPRQEDAEGPRLGISVGRKVGGAVDRNRVKRLLREAFWEVAGELQEHEDYVIVARPAAAALAAERGVAGMGDTLREALRGAAPPAGGQA